MGKKNELVKVEPGTLPILQGESVAAALQANLGGLELTANDLERIKVPSSGSTMWTYETLEGECSEKQIVGVIIYHKLVRLYWAKKIDEGGSGQPPDCHCDNGINPVGVGSPGGKCIVCPHAQFGSAAKGGGQACQQRWALFMALPWSRIPVLLSAPPTSLAPIKRYMLRLSSNGVPYWSVLTTLALDVKQNAAGIKYASIVPSMVERIEGEARERFRKLNEELAPLFSTIAVEGTPGE
ncbi:MAG TPA: hypothetical protein VM186_14325 [Planctomycetota bacterium]|nr:hypothetical protein [Planctomycetota bacterium]